MAPPFANLFLGKFEQELILNVNEYKEKILFYKQTKDFLMTFFFLWGGSLKILKMFLEYLTISQGIHPKNVLSSCRISYIIKM